RYPKRESSYSQDRERYPKRESSYSQDRERYPKRESSYSQDRERYPKRESSYSQDRERYPKRESFYSQDRERYPKRESSDSQDRERYPKRESSDSQDRERYPKRESSYSQDRDRYPKRESSYSQDRERYPKRESSDSQDRERYPKRESSYSQDRERYPKRESSYSQDRERYPKRESSYSQDRERYSETGSDRDPELSKRLQEHFNNRRSDSPKGGRGKTFRRNTFADSLPSKSEIFTHAETVMRLNRYMAISGCCARRDADDLIVKGQVTVNGDVVTTLGARVNTETDVIQVNGKTVKPQHYVYILLNKPKNYITTTEDDKERKTVLELLNNLPTKRVFPVGRLDRNTTGILLITNDGSLTEKLTHPSFEVSKVYHVRLDRPVKPEDMEALQTGIMLEDGFSKVDKISYIEINDRISTDQVGVEIHMGKNRIIRRMFEHLGYQVMSLDRTKYASLTKKGVPRGHWRFLTSKEVAYLKMLPDKSES
ncbi:MAG: pseudouridine synthase, partial [Bacteroidia bacterium]|nr:pseudouridine synthase [Bacteroidia bacterium]